MNNNNNVNTLDIRYKPQKWYQWVLYPIQMLLAVFVATVLIANICGTPIASCLIGAAVGTIVYELFTGFKSPMFISSCGATVSAVVGALALGGGQNYVAVVIGGIIIALVYAIFALIIKFGGRKLFDRIFPPVIVGPVTMVIGLNLAGFIPTYLSSSASGNNPKLITWLPILVALITMTIVALTSHYGKGFMKTVAFLIGLMSGYIICLILELSGAYNFNIVSTITNIKWFNPKDFAFMNWATSPFEWSQLPQIILLFLPVSICAALEHYSDHKTLSNILGTDLTQNPGLHRTLIGDGVASAVGTAIGGLPNTSYGESVATIGFSKVGSVWITMISAIILGVMGFIAPITAFINSIPSVIFAGCAMILYGYISASGLKTIMGAKVNLENSKNLIIVSVILTVGVSGVFFLSESFAGVSLAMVLGIILNLILKDSEQKITNN